MFQHEESDEDDYEGYFLKPVNGYNISDRIKSANKELFECDSIQSGDLTETFRKVSFRPEPDYEPDSEPDDCEASSCDEDDIEAINQVLDRNDDNILFEEIIKVDTDRDTNNQMSNDENDIVGDDEIEEICEAINNVDVVDVAVNDESIIVTNGETKPDEIFNEITSTIDSSDGSIDAQPTTSIDLKSIKSRKSQPKSSSAKVRSTESIQNHHHNNRPNSSGHTKKSSESEFLKIQLNFKPCCEYKYLENDRLPRYCGYVSQYGLSKEQLEMREKRQERLKNRQSNKTAKQLQDETTKSEVNEEAFARWLQNKMRTSRSMTKNMYDYRPTKQTKKGKKKV